MFVTIVKKMEKNKRGVRKIFFSSIGKRVKNKKLEEMNNNDKYHFWESNWKFVKEIENGERIRRNKIIIIKK